MLGKSKEKYNYWDQENKGLAASKRKTILIKHHCLLSKEEKEGANKCKTIENFNTNYHK